MMHVVLDKEEVALRRRALFRLLRRFDFDAPEFRGEAISNPVPDTLTAPDYLTLGGLPLKASGASTSSTPACVTKIAGPLDWARTGSG